VAASFTGPQEEALAALLHAVVTAFAVAFQLGQAAGAPWGEYAMGGAYPGPFPPAMRALAMVQAGVLAGLSLIVLARAGRVGSLPEGLDRLAWLPVAFAAISTLLNLASRSLRERRLWVPLGLVLLACSLIVASWTV